jgi:hypothetical protein
VEEDDAMSWEQVGNIRGPAGPPGPPGGTVVEGVQFIFGEIPTGALNGTNKIFTAANAFAPDSLAVFLNGLHQRRVDDYDEISTTQFQFVVAPRATDSISIDYVLPGVALVPIFGETPSGLINGANTIFGTAYIYQPDLLAVFQCGLRLRRTSDYSETGAQQFQLVAAPLVGDTLSVDYFQG